MTTATTTRVTVGDETVEVTEDAAKVITKALKKRERAVIKARRELAEQTTQIAADQATAQKKIATKQAKLTTLRSKQDALQRQIDGLPAEHQRLATERLDVIHKANAIFGQALDWSNETTEGIRRVVVLAKLGDLARSWNDSEIQTSFETLQMPRPRGATDQLFDAFSGKPRSSGGRDRNGNSEAQQTYNRRLEDAYKTAGIPTPDDTVH